MLLRIASNFFSSSSDIGEDTETNIWALMKKYRMSILFACKNEKDEKASVKFFIIEMLKDGSLN